METTNKTDSNAKDSGSAQDTELPRTTRSSKGKKYYSVVKARDSEDVGIYTDWASTSKVVTGVPNNQHQATYRFKETILFFIRQGIPRPPITHKDKKYTLRDFYSNFVDDELIEDSFWEENKLIVQGESGNFHGTVPEHNRLHLNLNTDEHSVNDSLEFSDTHEELQPEPGSPGKVSSPGPGQSNQDTDTTELKRKLT